MDPITATLAIVGTGMQIFGGISQANAAHQAAEISQDEARHEQSINDIKQQQMELEGRRTQMENIRNNQRARANAEAAAVNQGANKGSGLQGGLAQINDQSLFNMSGVNSALQFGRDINTQNQAISQDKIKMAGVQSSSATGAGISSMGGAVLKASGFAGQLSKGFGGGSNGNYSGTPGASNTGGLY